MNLDKHTSPFHPGEQEVQAKLGVQDKMEKFGRQVIRDHMPQQHRDFYQKIPFILAGHSDDEGWPWASFIYGDPGFIHSADPKSLSLRAKPVAGDPLQASLTAGRHVGLLGIELPSRRRNRLSASISKVDEQGIDLKVIQSFGNCPQYIQTRQLRTHQQSHSPQVIPMDNFDADMTALISNSDTFFVASHYAGSGSQTSNGADVSHRGGKPGFVRVDNKKLLSIPDYLGNFHFNTLGNFVLNPKAGLLFIDFENGHLLSLTGRVEIQWHSAELEHFAGAERLWQFHLEKGVYIKYALPFSWKFEDYSPTTLVTGSWQESEQHKIAQQQRNSWQGCVVQRVEQESALVKSFYLAAENAPLAGFKAGQFVTLKAEVNGKQEIRTYTLSSAPGDKLYRISVKLEEQGTFSRFLHKQISVGSRLAFKAPTGAFFIDPEQALPAVLLAGGIGITPMISMARHILQDAVRTRSLRPTVLVCAVRNLAQRSFYQELTELAEKSNGYLQVIWVLSEPEEAAKAGRDYHQKGHISRELLQAVLPIDDYQFFLCGPAGFMQSMYDLCLALGVADTRIMAESFGPASLLRHQQNSPTIEPVMEPAEEAIIQFSQSQFEQSWSSTDGNLLEFAEAHGLQPEFGCRSGQCGSCKVKLLEGQISYTLQPSCEREADEVVLCCALPAKNAEGDISRISLNL